ncbi:imelysin family protein [Paucibacter sediminis]|uniref:Imelysin family protein n=1 Tax=Paucibacter sediminis TaxID=3019553 RepID=A0AA95NHG4_9BURK|nr:imelysin family protein [Paucibacter sp. S2-9]WIT14170.1 imelysin family protein [Paucibacter sp. S2-9]
MRGQAAFLIAWLLAGAAALAQPVAPTAQELRPVLQHHAALVHATYADTLTLARRLQQAVRRFTQAPSAAALAGARQAWLQARERYALTEAFRFHGGPIDGDDGPEPRLNAWPVDETYIDALIARCRQPISKRTLSALNTRDGEENVATGWHAIEYLLWGQDLSAEGPGDRPHTDYVDGRATNADRRRLYLATVTALLVDDLAWLEQAWAPARANYRRRFERGDQESLRGLIVGLGSLSRAELAGERLEVALASRDQEDEQSCFSDSTHRDIVGDALGIQNAWLGRYAGLDDRQLKQGPALRDLVAARDPALAERLTAQMAESLQAAEAIEPPFDREILGGSDAPGRQRIKRVIDALLRQSSSLVEAARALGIQKLNWVRKP